MYISISVSCNKEKDLDLLISIMDVWLDKRLQEILISELVWPSGIK